MAKRGKYHKTTRFSFDGLDVAHYRTTEQYVTAVQTLFDRAAMDVATHNAHITPGDSGFRFDDYPSARKHMEQVCGQLTANVTATIQRGSRKEWLFACEKNDRFLAAIMDTSKIKKPALKKMQDRNLDALSTFQSRKVSGMDLSQRVWKYVGDWRDHMEMSLDVGLGEGKSAAQLARYVKQDLRDPNRLFRRVRDKHGNLRLSKAAAAFHPGQGVYRSSVKNAQRLTRSEINMAYRESDWQRWQQLDFVVGFEIKRSNHEPQCKCDLCERLAGKYPKTFKFVGWHPQCMCKCIPILMDDETFDANELSELRAALRGEEYHAQQAKNVVTDVPDGFREWMAENAEKQANWNNTPYFIRDNFKNGTIADGLKIKLPSVTESGKVEFHKPFDQLTDNEQAKFYDFLSDEEDFYDLERACRLYGVDMSSWQRMKDAANDDPGAWYWRKDEIVAERKRIESQLMAIIAKEKKQAEQIIADFANVVNESIGWIGDVRRMYDYAKRTFDDEATEKYPNYRAVLNSASGGSLDASRIRQQIAKSKQEYADAIQAGKDCIAKYGKDVDVAALQTLLNEPRTETRNALRITNEIKKAIQAIESAYNAKQNGALTSISDRCEKNKIEHRNVGMHAKQPTADEIIERISGGDTTGGSCSSMAFTFAANMGGMDVLDYRGGMSKRFFSSSLNIFDIAKSVGGVVNKNFNDYKNAAELLAMTQSGKYYYFTCGAHAAVVRKTATGYEYLELQSPVKERNGWHPLNDERLKNRFGAKRSHSTYGHKYETQECIIDIDLLIKDAGFRKMMGYINTASDKQNKGAHGHEY